MRGAVICDQVRFFVGRRDVVDRVWGSQPVLMTVLILARASTVPFRVLSAANKAGRATLGGLCLSAAHRIKIRQTFDAPIDNKRTSFDGCECVRFAGRPVVQCSFGPGCRGLL